MFEICLLKRLNHVQREGQNESWSPSVAGKSLVLFVFQSHREFSNKLRNKSGLTFLSNLL